MEVGAWALIAFGVVVMIAGIIRDRRMPPAAPALNRYSPGGCVEPAALCPWCLALITPPILLPEHTWRHVVFFQPGEGSSAGDDPRAAGMHSHARPGQRDTAGVCLVR